MKSEDMICALLDEAQRHLAVADTEDRIVALLDALIRAVRA